MDRGSTGRIDRPGHEDKEHSLRGFSLSKARPQAWIAPLVGALLLLTGCGQHPGDPASEAPPPAKAIIPAGDVELVHLDHPELFPTVDAGSYQSTSSLAVTGQVQPDVSREIPVVLLANGRVVDTKVRLGDYVHKGQLVLQVQSTDVSNAFGQYLKAKNDERLARTVLDRDQLLFAHGAIAKSQVEIAQDAEDDAVTDLKAALQQLQVLGVNPQNPGETVNVYAPASGFIIQQNVTQASTVGNGLNGSPNAFVIADLTHVWVICNVYENDLAQVRLGQPVDIRLLAYPDRLVTGRVGDIGAVLDPTLRTALVRVQVDNPGFLMRVGMFANATIHGRAEQIHADVPATAILHLHDRDWVYLPAGGGQFRRAAIEAGVTLAGGMQEVLTGVQPGQPVVRNALELQNTAAQ